jgi:hypothetical protein
MEKLLAILATATVISCPAHVTYTAPVTDNRAGILDAYFEERDMPLAGHGEHFVAVSDQCERGLDWRLLPGIGIRESSGGKQMCGNNPFGWGSCTLNNFESIDEAIDVVARNLCGDNPNTARYYGGDTRSKLQSYNGTVLPSYPDEVIAIMEDIDTGSDVE